MPDHFTRLKVISTVCNTPQITAYPIVVTQDLLGVLPTQSILLVKATICLWRLNYLEIKPIYFRTKPV